MEEREIFWSLIAIIRKNRKKIPEQILTKVGKISADVERVMGCPMGRVDYNAVLSTLTKLLKENYGKIPKEIQEKIKEALKSIKPVEKTDTLEPHAAAGGD